jgi:hypothetical protein
VHDAVQARAAVERDRAELAEIRRQMETELQQQADELQQQAVAGVSAQTAELERLRAALEVGLYTTIMHTLLVVSRLCSYTAITSAYRDQSIAIARDRHMYCFDRGQLGNLY